MKTKGEFKGLIPFIIFVTIYLGSGIVLGMAGVEMSFYQLPAPIAAFAGIISAFILFKGSIEEKFKDFIKGCGHEDIMVMCIIYLLAGAFGGVSNAMGGVDSVVNMGLTFIPVHYIPAGLFVIGAFISTSTGTSVGSIVAIAPVAVGLAESSGISMALTLAAVMGGSMFGDNLSVISDTTIAATRTQGVEMRDKFRANISLALPAAIITIIMLVVLGRPEGMIDMAATYNYDVVKVIPYLVVLVLAIAGVNVFAVLTGGILLSGLIGLFKGDFTLLSFSNEIYNGFSGMQEIFLLSLLTGGLAQMVTKAGGIQWLLESVQKKITGRRSAQFGVAALVAMTDAAVANNTVAIIINGPLAKEVSEKYCVEGKRSAALLDIFSCIVQGVIPYGAQMLILLSFSKGTVTPFEVIPLLWYQHILAVFAFIYILRDKEVKSELNENLA
ncbi:Na+/H+ antiporter NhaC family protein [Ilyobacter polytropus]|uniref:Methionine transporter, NhaC family n=1 Tax=Ilyobacter polytropus (strain ATCC 51220 / DSM 2926 / LMG 16218 / CuHBu1) TaxID=572544 RepID=E3H8J0_ILYPC|nr:Na+/H+ antiporter NhaC family protein [Ilyobacter polytropus]ADO82972.1 putative methionine transporter, NhaC family [Ilyobacter polytropus DSM 2926]